MWEVVDALAKLPEIWAGRRFFAQIGRAIWRRVGRRGNARLLPAVATRLGELAAFVSLIVAAALAIGCSDALGLTTASRTLLLLCLDAAVVGLIVSTARLGLVLPDEEPSRRPFR